MHCGFSLAELWRPGCCQGRQKPSRLLLGSKVAKTVWLAKSVSSIPLRSAVEEGGGRQSSPAGCHTMSVRFPFTNFQASLKGMNYSQIQAAWRYLKIIMLRLRLCCKSWPGLFLDLVAYYKGIFNLWKFIKFIWYILFKCILYFNISFTN